MRLEERCILALGELAMGTKVYEPLAMEGLALFLQINGYDKEIESVILDSGLLPLVPSYYGLSNAKNMRFLGTNENQEPNQRAELVLRSNVEEKDKEYIENFVLHKITSKEQAAAFAREQLQALALLLKDAEFHYMHGEEDRKNIEALEELKINDYMRIQKNYEDLEEKLEKTKQEIEKRSEELAETEAEKTLLQYARKILRFHEGDDFKKKVEELINNRKQEFEALGADSERFKRALKSAKSVSDVKKKLESVYQEIKDLNQEIRHNQKQVRNCEIQLNAIEREKEASGFFRITKRQHITPDEEELLYRMSKKEYNDLLYTILPKSHFHVHTDQYSDVSAAGLELRVYHSMNFNGDSPCSDSLARMKKKNNKSNKNSEKVPDMTISAHGGGGFRFMLQPKNTENTIKGDSRETPEMTMDMKLATFQSRERLEWARKKGIKNWHTKRYEPGDYASGATIYRVKDNGVAEVEFIDLRQLIEFGQISRKIHELRQEGKKKQARILERYVKLDQDKLAEISGDDHLGCPNVKGRPSNYDFIKASQKYQEKTGLPKIVVASEVLHGTLEKIFSSNKQYFSRTPAEREALEQKIRSSDLSAEEKLDAITDLYKEDHEAIPITSNSIAKLEAKRRVIPYLEKVLEAGGTVVLVSGNHYNCSTGEDEAYELASMLPLKYIDNGQIQIFDGLGAKYGSGTMRLPNGKKLYSAHKPHNGTDEVAGAMKQILSANIDASIAVFFDRHHCGGGYSNNTAFVAAPGKQPWNKYVDAIGKYPGLRGIVNIYTDHKKLYYKWEFVLDPALEKLMGEKR